MIGGDRLSPPERRYKMEISTAYHDFLKDMYSTAIMRDHYLLEIYAKAHRQVIEELHLENKWKFKWFMLFKHHRKKYHKLFNEYIAKNEGKPIIFNMMGEIK